MISHLFSQSCKEVHSYSFVLYHLRLVNTISYDNFRIYIYIYLDYINKYYLYF